MVIWALLNLLFSMFLVIHIYNNNKTVSALVVIEIFTHTKKLIKLFRNSRFEIKVEIVTNLLRDKAESIKTKLIFMKIDIR